MVAIKRRLKLTERLSKFNLSLMKAKVITDEE